MPKPNLQAMVLADHVYRDAATGKFIIAGTFSQIWQAEQKAVPQEAAPQSEITGQRHTFTSPITRAGSPYLYVALSEVHGRASLGLRYVNLDDASVLIEGQIEITATDPVAISEYVFPLPALPIVAGNFSLDLLYEGEILGSWRVAVKPRKPDDKPKTDSA